MFFLFGWGRRTNKEYGPALPVEYPNCNNKTFWHLLQSRSWFTLFFVPVIPYESGHYLLCTICGLGTELRGEDIETAKYLCDLTVSFMDKEITEQSYTQAVNEAGILEALPREPTETVLQCPSCGAAYRLEDYRDDADHIYCSVCRAELPSVAQLQPTRRS